VKCTYGTGNFILMNTGTTPRRSDARLLTTIAWVLDGAVTYAVEGSVFVTGAAIQWLRDELRLIADAPQSEALARSVPDAGGVYLVPAFVGLGAPYWDPYARGAIAGLTRGSSQAHIVRAALESVAFQTQDVLDAMQRDAGLTIRDLRVDGGMTGNDFLLQFQADISDLRITRPVVTQTTALGASYLAGLATGFWSGLPEIAALWRADAVFEPAMPGDRRRRLRRDWQRAVERARAWIEPEEESRGLDAGAPSIS
jgi:glycerol kinase